MADDLDAFFKSKNKAGKKKKSAQDIDALGKKLEKSVRKQEELDKEEEERQKHLTDPAGRQDPQPDNEDSEWHNYLEDNQVDLSAVGVKDMEIGEPEPEPITAEEAEREEQKKKTWGSVPPTNTEEDKPKQDTPPPQPAPQEPQGLQRYVPPSRRMEALSASGRESERPPALDNEELFPTLGDADSIAKRQEEERKKLEHMRKVGTGTTTKATENNNEGEFKIATGKWAAARREPQIPTGPAGAEPAAPMPKPGSYVPPHLRKQMQGSSDIQTQNRFSSLQQ